MVVSLLIFRQSEMVITLTPTLVHSGEYSYMHYIKRLNSAIDNLLLCFHSANSVKL